MKFPTLYKKTNTGAIQEWNISVRKVCDCEMGNGKLFTTEEYDLYSSHCDADNLEFAAEIEIKFGQVGTYKPQKTGDLITEGKNVGRSNETTPFEQACAEAKSKWEHQKKKGYVESIEAAEAGKLDELIEGGIEPMLAHTFEKQGHKIKYPCYVQGKLDGIRMIAVVEDGVCTLWSRTRKPITSLPHIIEEIEKNFKEDVVLDGEAYNHDFKSNFEHIVHLVRQEEPDTECTDVQYHIYDLVNDKTFDERILWLTKRFSSIKIPNFKYLKLTETHMVENENQVSDWFSDFKEQGYEGAILRNANGLYVNKRSYDLIKVKEMQDDEFEIIGIEEGRGKLSGHVGAFVCKTRDGQEFKAKPAGATERLREYFLDHGLWQGRFLTVQYQDLTSYGIPRFPVGLRIREKE